MEYVPGTPDTHQWSWSNHSTLGTLLRAALWSVSLSSPCVQSSTMTSTLSRLNTRLPRCNILFLTRGRTQAPSRSGAILRGLL
ncbi:hypothetical protein GOODEAATRI_025331 [Goodea atripinnis]|uniref:Uncharacterized protein n=1 Tax=Goodea atripinnis TaxID=208336 RepID=A0ABV0PH48_9TELE